MIFSVSSVGIHVYAMYQMVSYSIVYNRGQQPMAPGAISYSPWTKRETVHSVVHVMTPCSCMVHIFYSVVSCITSQMVLNGSQYTVDEILIRFCAYQYCVHNKIEIKNLPFTLVVPPVCGQMTHNTVSKSDP